MTFAGDKLQNCCGICWISQHMWGNMRGGTTAWWNTIPIKGRNIAGFILPHICRWNEKASQTFKAIGWCQIHANFAWDTFCLRTSACCNISQRWKDGSVSVSVAISQKLADEMKLSFIAEVTYLPVLCLTLLLKGCTALKHRSDSSWIFMCEE